jgi:hypothetical protein
VFVSSVDDISPFFDNIQASFPLTINGENIDATKVNAESMFVSLGGVMQIPIAQPGTPSAGPAYSVYVNSVGQLEILFVTAPVTGVTCNIRIITSDEFLTCPLPENFFNTTLQDGPGIIVNENNQIVAIDPGIIGT